MAGQNKKNQKSFYSILPLFLSLLFLSSCGQESFDTQHIQRAISPNVILTVPPKVDIVLFQDVSGSMTEPSKKLKAQIQSFANSINKSWDFRFIVLPLQFQDTALRSKYIIARDCDSVPNNRCLPTDQADQYEREGGFYDVDQEQGVGGGDLGFENIKTALSKLKSSGFLRNDALLSIIPLTNGNDTTGLPMEDRGDGTLVRDVDDQYNDDKNSEKSLTSIYNDLIRIKKASKLSFYSIAAKQSTFKNCHGEPADEGSRYNRMVIKVNDANKEATNGKAYDVCSNKITGVLGDIATQMLATTRNIHFNFVALARKPDPDTLKVYKNGHLVPRSTTNGWSLFLERGEHTQQEDKDTSYDPAGHKKSGYFIQMHGNARYTGQDDITVEYDPTL